MRGAISGLSHAALRVTDLGRARNFYVDVLGFPVVMEEAGLVVTRAGSGLLAIRGPEGPTPKADRFDPYRVGLDHLSFRVDSLEALQGIKRDLDAAGVRNEGIKDEGAGNAKALVFYDPDGIALELYYTPVA